MKILQWTIACICMLWSTVAFAQESIEAYDPIKFNVDAHALMKEGKLIEAEKLFSKIHVSDSLYNEVLFNRALCLRLEGQIDRALELVEEGLELNDQYVPDFNINKASCLDSLGKTEEAIELIESVEKQFPFNYDLKIKRSDLYSSLGAYNKSIELVQECILNEPVRRSHHVYLANLFYKSKGLTHVVLPLTAAIALDPENEGNLNLVQTLNKILSSKSEIKEPLFAIDSYDESFEEVDDLVSNYIALSDDYKIPGVISVRYLKQLHLILSESNLDQDAFFTNVYLKKFKPIIENNVFGEFAGLLLLISKNASHQKYINKNYDVIKKIYGQLYDSFEAMGEKKKAPEGFLIDEVEYLYNDEKRLSIITTFDKTSNIIVGPTWYINKEGTVETKGTFDEKGNRQGEWLWYHSTGELFRTGQYIDGEFDGVVTDYYKDGGLSASYNFKMGKRNGISEYYKLIGYKYEEQDYIDGLLDGEVRNYYPDGTLEAVSKVKADQKEGPQINYYEDGSIRSKSNYVADKLTGEHVTYFRNGVIDFKEHFNEGKSNGAFISVYKNGKTFLEGQVKNDNKIGVWTTYHRDGTLDKIEEYDLNGKKNGLIKYYAANGILENEATYKSDELVRYVNYDKDGNIKSEYKEKKHKLTFVSTRLNGSVASQGQFINGLRTGTWQYTDPYGQTYAEEVYRLDKLEGVRKQYFQEGVLQSTITYREDQLNGPNTEYYANGNVKIQANWKNGNYHGRFVEYFMDGTIYKDLYYTKGVQNGINKYYYPGGQIYLKEVFELGYIMSKERYNHKGEITGIWVSKGGGGKEEYSFGPGKGVMGVSNYSGGDYNGESLRFHVNGNKRYTSNYINGLINGETISYDIDEKVLYEYNYHYGDSHGEFRWYYPDGSISQKSSYEYDKINGESFSYYENGEIGEVLSYRYDKIINEKDYSETGDLIISINFFDGYITSYNYLSSNKKPVEDIPVESGTAKIEAYFSNGNKSVSYELKHGKIDGKYYQYHSNGNIHKELNYINGSLDGVQILYYANGNKKSTSMYTYDLINGINSSYYEDGTIKKEEAYLLDEKHGDSIFYNKDGSIKRTLKYHGDVIYDVE